MRRKLIIISLIVILIFSFIKPLYSIDNFMKKYSYIMVIVANGINKKELLHFEKIGNYPAVSKMLREGLSFDNCYSPLISIPETILYELFTGHPSNDVDSARLYLTKDSFKSVSINDRTEIKIPAIIKTIFDYFKEDSSLSFEFPICKGAKVKKWGNYELEHYLMSSLKFKKDTPFDIKLFWEFRWLIEDELPYLSVVFLNDPENSRIGRRTPSSEMIHKLDRFLGLIFLYLKKLNYLDDGLVILITLPSKAAGKIRVNLKRLIKKKFGINLKIVDGIKGYMRKVHRFGKKDQLVLAPNGRSLLLYSRILSPETMFEKSNVLPREDFFIANGVTLGDLSDYLISRDEVKFIIYPSGWRKIRIRAKRGLSEILWYYTGMRYRVVKGKDPLEYDMNPKLITSLDSAFYSKREMLNLFKNEKYPGIPTLVREFWEWKHAPAMVIVLKKKYSIKGIQNPGSGGGLDRDSIYVPIFFYGPGIPHGRITLSRTRDILPTILNLNGIKYNLKSKGFKF